MIIVEETEGIVIPEEVYDEICIMLNCDYITFMGITQFEETSDSA